MFHSGPMEHDAEEPETFTTLGVEAAKVVLDLRTKLALQGEQRSADPLPGSTSPGDGAKERSEIGQPGGLEPGIAGRVDDPPAGRAVAAVTGPGRLVAARARRSGRQHLTPRHGALHNAREPIRRLFDDSQDWAWTPSDGFSRP